MRLFADFFLPANGSPLPIALQLMSLFRDFSDYFSLISWDITVILIIRLFFTSIFKNIFFSNLWNFKFVKKNEVRIYDHRWAPHSGNRYATLPLPVFEIIATIATVAIGTTDSVAIIWWYIFFQFSHYFFHFLSIFTYFFQGSHFFSFFLNLNFKII